MAAPAVPGYMPTAWEPPRGACFTPMRFPRTNVAKLDHEIAQLEIRRNLNSGGLSDGNRKHLVFLRKWREFANHDVVVVLVPRGALEDPEHVRNTARTVEIDDKGGADLFAFAHDRYQEVRLATDAEVAEYRRLNEEERARVRGQMARTQQDQAQAMFRALFSGGAPAGLPSAEQGPALPPVSEAALTPPTPAPGVPAQMGQRPAALELGDAKLVELLAGAGFASLEAIADASPEELARVEGVSHKRAAELIARASRAVAARKG